MKKFLVLCMCLVLALGTIGFVGCDKLPQIEKMITEQENATSVMSGTSVQSVKLSGLVASTFSGEGPSLRSGETTTAYLSKTITATVLPETAQNKKVDFSVSWGQDATYASDDVSEYVTVEQATDGALTATVKCFKGFGDDTIIIRCITRDGGYEAFCFATYVGIASDIEIENVSGAELKYTEERGEYYEFYTNHEYVFNFRGVNALGAAKSDDIIFSDSGYFHATVNGSQGYYFFAKLDTARGALKTGEEDYPVRFLIDNEQFFSVTYSRNEDGSLQVRISVKNTTLDTYKHDGSYPYIVGMAADNIRSWINDYYNLVPELRNTNRETARRSYFYVSVGGDWWIAQIFKEIRFNIVSSVDSVALSPETIEF